MPRRDVAPCAESTPDGRVGRRTAFADAALYDPQVRRTDARVSGVSPPRPPPPPARADELHRVSTPRRRPGRNPRVTPPRAPERARSESSAPPGNGDTASPSTRHHSPRHLTVVDHSKRLDVGLGPLQIRSVHSRPRDRAPPSKLCAPRDICARHHRYPSRRSAACCAASRSLFKWQRTPRPTRARIGRSLGLVGSAKSRASRPRSYDPASTPRKLTAAPFAFSRTPPAHVRPDARAHQHAQGPERKLPTSAPVTALPGPGRVYGVFAALARIRRLRQSALALGIILCCLSRVVRMREYEAIGDRCGWPLRRRETPLVCGIPVCRLRRSGFLSVLSC